MEHFTTQISDSVMEKYREFFDSADVDGSGQLSFTELSQVLRSHGYKGTETQLKEMFGAFDFSGDNKISKEEYLTAMNETPPDVHRGAATRKVFLEFDKDGSGSIDAGEMQAVLAEMGTNLTESEAARLTELCDEDGSGTVNYEEFMEHVFGQ